VTSLLGYLPEISKSCMPFSRENSDRQARVFGDFSAV
jgi:hypothetical protein